MKWIVQSAVAVTTLCLLLDLVLAVSSQQCPSDDLQRTLKLLVSLPFPQLEFPLFDPSWNEGNRVLPALHLARDQINNRTDLLPCHQLELITVDGGCDIIPTIAVSTAAGLFREGQTRDRVVGVVGPGCSASALELANVIRESRVEVVQIHGGGSLLLANRTRYNYSLGILGSTQSFIDLSVALLKRNGWSNIAVLFESSRIYYTSTKEAFLYALNQDTSHAVTVRFVSPVYSTFYPLDGIRNSLSRIVFVFTSLPHLRRILCLAYHEGLIHSAYQWVIISHRLSDIIATLSDTMTFTYDRRNYTCTIGEIRDISLHATFLINYELISDSKTSDRFANTTFDEFLDLYRERAEEYNVTTTYWSYYFYDAVWAWARVLHRLTVNNSKLFDNFEYGNRTLAGEILEEFYANDFVFEGMSGRITFNPSNGFFNRTFYLYQIVDGKERRIGYSDGSSIQLFEEPIVISDDVRADTSVSHWLIGIFAFLHFLFFLIILILHVLTVVYRASKSVKASSPNLSHFAFSGAYLFIFALMLFLFLQMREHSANISGPICHTVWVWLFPISFTLVIGTTIVRTWRLYRIFNHYLDPGPFISNPALVSMLLIMLSVDVVIATVWTAVDPRQLIITQDTIENGLAREEVTIRTCRSENDSIWLSLMLSYKVILLLITVILALLTRHIPNKTFATTTLQVFSYVYSATFAIGFALYFFFLFLSSASYRLDSNINYAILYIMGTIMVVLFIVCVFGPPLVPVIRDKSGVKNIHLSEKLTVLSLTRNRDQQRKQSETEDEVNTRVRKTSADALLY
jgi:ABC-type branched-subunit amino acid transport system substrate-binding protein